MLSAATTPNVGDDRFRQLVESIDNHAIYMLDVAGRVVTWNLGAQQNKGYCAREVLGKHFRMFFTPEDLASGVPARNLLETRETGRCSGEGWRLRKNGERFWASFTITCIRDDTGRLTGFAKVTRDLTDKKCQEDAMLALQRELREERDTLHAASESSMDAFFLCEALRDADGEIEDFLFTLANRKAETLVAIPRDRLIGGRMCELFPSTREQGLFDRYKSVVLTGDPMNHEFAVMDEKVLSSWMRVQAVKLRDGVAITASDITERKRDEAHIVHMAQHDHLTGLPNRTLLNDRLDQAIAGSKRNRTKAAVLSIDLDGFKKVNDTLGHAAGDAVLVTSAVRLKASIRATDTVIRIGGDEFVVIMPDISEDASILHCAEKIIASLQQAMEIDGHALQVSCSVGIAVYPDSAHTGADLLTHSDAAMYLAKRSGKNQLAVYTLAALTDDMLGVVQGSAEETAHH